MMIMHDEITPKTKRARTCEQKINKTKKSFNFGFMFNYVVENCTE